MEADAIVKGFVDHYYQAFDTDRSKLMSLYRDDSQLTFEGIKCVGTQAIGEKFMSLAFKSSQHKLQSVDYQQSPQGGLFVFVTGQILASLSNRPTKVAICLSVQPEGESYPLKFSQTFHLVKIGDAFVLSNDLFRLNVL